MTVKADEPTALRVVCITVRLVPMDTRVCPALQGASGSVVLDPYFTASARSLSVTFPER